MFFGWLKNRAKNAILEGIEEAAEEIGAFREEAPTNAPGERLRALLAPRRVEALEDASEPARKPKKS